MQHQGHVCPPPLAYNMLLVVVCPVYAVKARHVPKNFNETRSVAFTRNTTCIVWLAFLHMHYSIGNNFEMQISTLCVAISLSASIAIIYLHASKVYIIVFLLEYNVRKLTRIKSVMGSA